MPHESFAGAAELRRHLLEFCDAASMTVLGRQDSYGRRGITTGIAAARDAIERTAVVTDGRRYLDDLLAALELVRTALDRPDDDDGYALGGLATVRREVERLLALR